jgi:hypothetical protein
MASMYKEDIVPIQKHAVSSPSGLYDVIEFVVCTIRRPLSLVGKTRDKIHTLGIQNAGLLSTHTSGLLWAKAFQDQLYIKAVREQLTIAETMKVFMRVKGIGLAKSAFCCQLLGLDVGCLDTWNYKALGMKEMTINKSAGEKHWNNAIGRYLEVSNTRSSEVWWNGWCKTVSGNRNNKSLPTAEAVSNFHVGAIIR